MVKDLLETTNHTYGPAYLTEMNGLAIFTYPYNGPTACGEAMAAKRALIN